MQYIPVGIDIAKNIFQVHYLNEQTGEIVNKAIKRAVFLKYFSNKQPCLIGMEACSGAQHWARKFIEMGHRVKLMSAHYVKAFNIGNKNDAADAKAIWLAVQQPCKEIAIKTQEQQSILALHRIREQLIKTRTMQINALRGIITEYGEVMGRGRRSLDKEMPQVLARLSECLPTILIDTLREQWNNLPRIDEQIALIEARLRLWLKAQPMANAIAQIPGVGLLTATAAIATMGNAKSFRSAREFAAWVGLVPRQSGSGGRTMLHGISKRGDTYLRTLLVHGARSIRNSKKAPTAWLEQLSKRRPYNVVLVALANKIARTIWAIVAYGRTYQSNYQAAQFVG